MVRGVRRCYVAGHRDHRRSLVHNGRQNRGHDHRPDLFRVDDATDIEARGIEKLLRVELFEGGGVHEPGLDIAGNGDDRGPFLARIWTVVNALVCLWLARMALDTKRA